MWVVQVVDVFVDLHFQCIDVCLQLVTDGLHLLTQFIVRSLITYQNSVGDTLELPDYIFPTERVADIVNVRRWRVCGRTTNNSTPGDRTLIEVQFGNEICQTLQVPRVLATYDLIRIPDRDRSLDFQDDCALDVFGSTNGRLREWLYQNIIVNRTKRFVGLVIIDDEGAGVERTRFRDKRSLSIQSNRSPLIFDLVRWRLARTVERILDNGWYTHEEAPSRKGVRITHATPFGVAC
ncbi:hypothetical protein D9M69_362690 [compost metagenome]